MADVNLQSLFLRIGNLERQNRRLKAAVALMVVLLCFVLFLGASGTAPRELRAERFIVTDARGHARAILGTNSDGTMLAVSDSHSIYRLQIGVTANGDPRVDLGDEAGNVRASLYVQTPVKWQDSSVEGAWNSNMGPSERSSDIYSSWDCCIARFI